MSRKLPTRTTVEKWIHDFPELEFNGIDLHCKVCQTVLSWNVKTRIKEHIATEKHKAHIQGNRSVRESQKQFNTDLVKMMVSCNMPWNTLDNPVFREFLQNCIEGKYNNVSVPAEGTVRTRYLSPACEEIQAEVLSELRDKNVWVTVDEIVDAADRNTVHVLVGGMQETGPMSARLVASKVLDEASPETISECVHSGLRKIWGNDLDKNRGSVLLYITDSSPYMKVSADYLKNVYKYENLLHVTCLAHELHRIAKTIRSCYPTIDKLIASMKKTFLKEQSRRKLFQEELPHIPLPPEPEDVRWSTWLEAASYYYVNFDDIKRMIDTLNANNTLSLSHTQQVFSDPTVREDLKYIHSHFSRVYLSMKTLENTTTSSGYSLVNALNVIFDLRHFVCRLSGPVAERVRNKFETVLESNSGFPTLCAIVNLLTGKEVDFSQPGINVPSLKNFTYFKYAPIATVGVERLFSSYKYVFNEKRQNIKPEHLELLLSIFFNSRND